MYKSYAFRTIAQRKVHAGIADKMWCRMQKLIVFFNFASSTAMTQTMLTLERFLINFPKALLRLKMHHNLLYVWTAEMLRYTVVFSKNTKTYKIANTINGHHCCKTPPGWQNIT